jgi:23S rRNA pseudouridine1911/1915/1917 synthase
MGISVQSAVPRNRRPGPLLSYLTGRFTYHPEEQWRGIIESGMIRVNGNPCAPSTEVRPGDSVAYAIERFEEPPADLRYTVVYEDQWMIAVDKPGNLLVHRSGKSLRSNLAYLLRQAAPEGAAVPYPVNRLDRETSGIVLAAKGRVRLREFHRLFSQRKVEKTYIALVHGVPPQKAMTVDMPIGKERGSAVSYRHAVDTAHGKAACTRIELVESVGGAYSLVRAYPLTGRTHQVRVHLAAVGCPVAGDKLYSMSEREYLAWRAAPRGHPHGLPMDRQALHCARLCFTHPVTGAPVRIEAPVPADMTGAIARLRTAAEGKERTQ